VQDVRVVRRDGVALAPDAYTWCRERGWLTVSTEPTDALLVEYTISRSLDMAVSNWDATIGNQLYYNLRLEDCNGNGVADGCDVHDGTSLDVNANGVPDECECVADITGDGQVDVVDLLDVLAWWGPCPTCPEDIDANGVVDVVDLLIVLGAWGACG
jgi:hypothetical protein